MLQKKISHMVLMGDSLSDRGTVYREKILGFIPMAWFAGILGNTPKGRFTNGYVWADAISSFFASDFIIQQLKQKYHCSNEEITNAIIAKESWVLEEIHYDYNLDNDLFVKFEGRDFIRSYDEGGLSAYDYAWKPSTSITRFFSRIILSTLEEKRKALLSYDEEQKVSHKQKAQTLVVEWSGANDLITVNAEPSIIEVDRAIKERVKNVEILLQKGYRHFVLINLPDLSLTPRFQNMTGKAGEEARLNAQRCVTYFNHELIKACDKFKTMFPHCYFDVFDINSFFVDAYNNPGNYGIDPAKLKQPYKTSPDFKMLPNGTSPAKGYMFWDDIHPTADVHAVLGNNFYIKYNQEFTVTEPEAANSPDAVKNISETTLKRAFRTRYGETLGKSQHGFFGSLSRSHIQYKTASVEDILKHALCDEGKRTREVITELQWIDKDGNINLNIPVLKNAMTNVQMQQANVASVNAV